MARKAVLPLFDRYADIRVHDPFSGFRRPVVIQYSLFPEVFYISFDRWL